MIHANSLAAYADIHLSDREAFVRNLYEPGIDYTDDQLAALEGKSNSRETSPRITGLRDKGIVIENKHGGTKNGRPVRTTRLAVETATKPPKQFCNCTFAGFLKAADGVTRCHNPIHGQPLYYGRNRT